MQDGKLYGLGAADMKGSLAAFLSAVAQVQPRISTDNLMLLIYVDEEYDFRGIRRFLASKEAAITPALTLSLDGELGVATGCRGLIEISLTAKGVSGHAANPGNGINVITETVGALNTVSQELGNVKDDTLGKTTTNIAAMQGGVLQEYNGNPLWRREGNVIPDTAKVVFEVRPATATVTADFVSQKIKKALKQRGLALAGIAVRHDLAPWPVQHDQPMLTQLANSYSRAGVSFAMSDRKLQGYIDAQMVAEAIPAPTYIIGTGGGNKHGADEYVPLTNLDAATKVYAALLQDILR